MSIREIQQMNILLLESQNMHSTELATAFWRNWRTFVDGLATLEDKQEATRAFLKSVTNGLSNFITLLEKATPEQIQALNLDKLVREGLKLAIREPSTALAA